jgi:hypothetical protein
MFGFWYDPENQAFAIPGWDDPGCILSTNITDAPFHHEEAVTGICLAGCCKTRF